MIKEQLRIARLKSVKQAFALGSMPFTLFVQLGITVMPAIRKGHVFQNKDQLAIYLHLGLPTVIIFLRTCGYMRRLSICWSPQVWLEVRKLMTCQRHNTYLWTCVLPEHIYHLRLSNWFAYSDSTSRPYLSTGPTLSKSTNSYLPAYLCVFGANLPWYCMYVYCM